MVNVLSGKEIAGAIRAGLKSNIEPLPENPKLAAVIFGDDEGSLAYARSKARTAGKIGIDVDILQFSDDISTANAIQKLTDIAQNPQYHGIILEEPLPKGIDPFPIREVIPPDMDVDCTTSTNLGKIISGEPLFYPATPQAIAEIFAHYGIDPERKHIVIVGRSRTVGLPLANMLLRKKAGGNATVTVCHSRTPELHEFTRRADILVVAVGRPRFIDATHVSPNTIVIDVGTNYTDEGLVGDVDHDSVTEVADAITPVPGGVGPVTVACLLKNVWTAFTNMQINNKR